MKRLLFLLILAVFLLSACGPSPEAVETAIAQTQAAQATDTPLPTFTPLPTETTEPSPTPVPMPDAEALKIPLSDRFDSFAKILQSGPTYMALLDLEHKEDGDGLYTILEIKAQALSDPFHPGTALFVFNVLSIELKVSGSEKLQTEDVETVNIEVYDASMKLRLRGTAPWADVEALAAGDILLPDFADANMQLEIVE